jgi:hypothetical protein
MSHSVSKQHTSDVDDIYERRNERDRAVETLRDGCERHPNSPGLLTRLSEFCLSVGDYEGAYNAGLKGLDFTDSDTLHYNVGLYYFRTVQLSIHG